MGTGFSHYSVMLKECIDGLEIKKDGLYVDCTAGGGGHSLEIAKRLDPSLGGHLIAIDRDIEAIEATRERLGEYIDRAELVNDNFANLREILGGREPDGVLIDLGVSSHQIDTAERGFSYNLDSRLDMRMNRADPVSAYEIVNGYGEEQLANIIYNYGEERFSRRIASAIVKKRLEKPIETTLELERIVSGAVPHKENGSSPAKRTFQAIRIEVNHELEIIEPTVRLISSVLKKGGVIAVITFHSLEDRIVKLTVNDLCTGCTCPPSFPVCVCGRKPVLEKITKKPIIPSDKENEENKRSHSAKLRLARKL
ncbi:MAG: 16S rRNA (cytosine(1402)-N(4))-methyltransferase RsmH [Firmicutes bacterium]|nr:16S rRNA (cytosine(1402)-N(4))-methyltransferase RsmH [Candidatus Colimorpha enterica]